MKLRKKNIVLVIQVTIEGIIKKVSNIYQYNN